MKHKETLTYSVKQLAECLGIGLSKTYELVKQPNFPALRIGKRIIIPKEALNDYLAGK